jgi:Putative DNA-binding domain
MHKSWPMSTAAPTLFELQLRLRRAVLGGDVAEIAAAIDGDGIDPAARLRIYRNHAFATMGAALKSTFPVVCRLVDERFFAYLAHEYLSEHPPRSRCLGEYGADLPEFLAGFEPCSGLPYLADVARFEWALNIAATAREEPSLSAEAFITIPADEAGYVRLRLQPSVGYFTSPWPIDAIWQANQQAEIPLVDLASGGASLEIRRAGEAVAWRPLDAGTFALRSALADSLVFAAAIEAAIQRDPEIDVTAALRRIFVEGLIVGFDVFREEA